MNTSMPASAVAIDMVGETLWLLAERAVWWPSTCTLFVADLHLGKAATFRAQGQPVPSGTTGANLDRLSELIRTHAATRIVFLGDLLHAVHAQQARVVDALQRWRDAHEPVACVLVRGNHDRHAGDPPPSLGFTLVDEPWPIEPDRALLACHHPQQVAAHGVLAGHWHPAVTLRGRAHDHERVPCYAGGEGLLVLPAFGEFTGSSTRVLPAGAIVYPIGGSRVWPGRPDARR